MDAGAAAGSSWVAGWARLTDACARPLATHGISPDAVTLTGLVASAAVPAVAAPGAAWPLLALVVLLVAALLDGVDGALASRTGRGSPWGRVIDPVADRCSDLFLLVTLGVLGGPWWLVAVAGATTLLLEAARAHAQVAGMRGPGAITVWERPSRVIVTSFATALCVLAWAVDLPWARPSDVATVAAATAVVLSLVGLAQLLRAVRRALAA